MSDKTQVMEDLKKAIGRIHLGDRPYLYKKKILTFLFKEEYHVSDSGYYDIVGEIFNSNPKNFMLYIYMDLRKKMAKLYGVEKRNEMEILQ